MVNGNVIFNMRKSNVTLMTLTNISFNFFYHDLYLTCNIAYVNKFKLQFSSQTFPLFIYVIPFENNKNIYKVEKKFYMLEYS